MVTTKTKKSSSAKKNPTWTNVMEKLKDMSSPDLIALIKELYSTSKDSKTFLNTRFCRSKSSIEDVKDIISWSVNPELESGNFRVSFADARKAISNYAKASGDMADVTDLRVYMCEQCASFVYGYCVDYAGYYNSWAAAIKSALIDIKNLPPNLQTPFVNRMMEVYQIARRYGYFMDSMAEECFKQYGFLNKTGKDEAVED